MAVLAMSAGLDGMRSLTKSPEQKRQQWVSSDHQHDGEQLTAQYNTDCLQHGFILREWNLPFGSHCAARKR